MSERLKILCVGHESSLLQTRCALLSYGGYDAEYTTTPDAEGRLKSERYALVLLPPGLRPEDVLLIRKALPESTKVHALEQFQGPRELLALVAHLLAGPTPCPAAQE